jgi:hypothetical protein
LSRDFPGSGEDRPITPHLETLETVGQGIDDALAKIVATRESLQAVLDREIDVPEFRQAIARLVRVEAELDRVEAKIAVREGLG